MAPKKSYQKKKSGKGKSKSYNKRVPSVAQLQKQINLMKYSAQPEKKTFLYYTQHTPVGQVVANASGHFIAEITPLVPQNSTSTGRIGNTIKCVSAYMRFQIYQQSACLSPMRLKIQVIRVVGSTFGSLSGVPAQLLDANPFISGGSNIYDYNCSRNIDFIKNYKILKTAYVYLKPDNFGSQVMIVNKKIGLKIPSDCQNVSFSADGSTALGSGQFLLFVTADSGNWSTTTASTLTGIAQLATNTGALMSSNIIFYYTDA